MAKRKRAAAANMAYPAGHDDWQAKQDLHTLVEAEKIKADSKRLRAAMACKRKEMKALQSV